MCHNQRNYEQIEKIKASKCNARSNYQEASKMLRTNYSIIKDAVELIAPDPHALMEYMVSFYAYSLKGLTKRKERDLQIIATEMQVLGESNKVYLEWRDDYNEYNIIGFDDFMEDDKDFAEAIKKMRGIFKGGKRKNYKRLKKKTTRLHKDIMKICTTNKISVEKHQEFYVGLRAGFFAYREAMVNVRRRLSDELYQLIPDTLSIEKEGKKYKIKDLYKETISHNFAPYYCLDDKIKLTKDDLRRIQLEIYPHLFRHVYKRIRA